MPSDSGITSFQNAHPPNLKFEYIMGAVLVLGSFVFVNILEASEEQNQLQPKGNSDEGDEDQGLSPPALLSPNRVVFQTSLNCSQPNSANRSRAESLAEHESHFIPVGSV